MTAEILLTQGFVAVIDDLDFDRVMEHKWRALVRPDRVYAQCSLLAPLRGRSELLHRLVLEVPSDVRMPVDHINGDGLDNRRSNLRLCTCPENTSHRHRLNRNNTSGFKGVIWSSQHNKWIARIGVRNTKIHLGLFTEPEDAARAYDAAALELHGEFASLNFFKAGSRQGTLPESPPMTVNPATVIRTLRQLKAAGVRTRSMHSDAIQYITDNKLAREVNWPAGFIEITPAGAEYIAENGGDE